MPLTCKISYFHGSDLHFLALKVFPGILGYPENSKHKLISKYFPTSLNLCLLELLPRTIIFCGISDTAILKIQKLPSYSAAK